MKCKIECAVCIADVLLGDSVNGSGQVLDVFARHSGHRDASVLGQVHAELLGDALHLLGVQSGEAEHTDLVSDVLPRALRSLLDQVTLEVRAHRDDTIGHALDLAQPLGAQRCVAQNLADQQSTVNGRIRVHWPDQDLDLRHAIVGLRFVGGEQGEGTDTFAVES